MATKLRANFMLERNFKRKWVAALRSGKYKQGRHALYNNDGYCCLGVMCMLRGASLIDMVNRGAPIDLDNFAELFNITDADDLEFFREYPIGAWRVPYRGEMKYLSSLNDSEQLSFKQIANIIERTVDTY